MEMVYGAIDVHKHVLQAVVLDPASGELRDARFPATREALREWAVPLQGRVVAVAIEATSGWRWVWRELSALGVRVELAEPAQARALRGKKRQAKNDRLDARWLALLLAKEMLPRSWIPPEDIQRLRDLTRLRQSLRHDRTSWAQRLHSILAHEGWPCSRSKLLSTSGRRWLEALTLDEHMRRIVDVHLAILDSLAAQMSEVERELRRLARSDRRLLALQTIYGVGPIVACHLLAEIGDARRFRRAEQVVRVAGLDPVVLDSADTRRRGRLSKQGSPHLRWALVQAAQHAAIHPASSPDGDHYLALKKRIGSQRAAVSTARRIAKRAYHVLAALENAAVLENAA
jgi:transposase